MKKPNLMLNSKLNDMNMKSIYLSKTFVKYGFVDFKQFSSEEIDFDGTVNKVQININFYPCNQTQEIAMKQRAHFWRTSFKNSWLWATLWINLFNKGWIWTALSNSFLGNGDGNNVNGRNWMESEEKCSLDREAAPTIKINNDK